MNKTIYRLLLIVLTGGMFLSTSFAWAQTLIKNIDGTDPQTLVNRANQWSGYMNQTTGWINKQQEVINKGVAGAIGDFKKSIMNSTAFQMGSNALEQTQQAASDLQQSVSDYVSQVQENVSSSVSDFVDSMNGSDLAQYRQSMADSIADAQDTISSQVSDWSNAGASTIREGQTILQSSMSGVLGGSEGTTGTGTLSGIAESAQSYLSNIPGMSLAGGLLGNAGGKTISGVVGGWGSKATPQVGFGNSGVNTGDSNALQNALTFSGNEMSAKEIQKVRQNFNNMARDISTSVIATGSANIKNAEEYDKTVTDKEGSEDKLGIDKSLSKGVPKGGDTTLEIAQSAQTLREHTANMNGTVATWFVMSNAMLVMETDRIALEAGTTLQDAISSTQPAQSDGVLNGQLGVVGNVLGM